MNETITSEAQFPYLVEFKLVRQKPPDTTPVEGVLRMRDNHRVLLQSPSDDAQELFEFLEECFLGNRFIQLIIAKLLQCRLDNIFHNLSQEPNNCIFFEKKPNNCKLCELRLGPGHADTA